MSRAGYYRCLARVEPAEAHIELRDRMQRITLSNRHYGYRRVSAELRRQGFRVNHKKVLRLMRNDNLLAIRKRRYVLTTDSDQHRAAYPNWAKTFQVDGIDQLWQADITYVRMRRSFVYLAVVMDSYSRASGGLGTRPFTRSDLGAEGVAPSDRVPAAQAGAGASFRSRGPIWFAGLRRAAETIGRADLDEPAWQSLTTTRA